MTENQFRNSDFERNDNDKYYTEYWCTEALWRAVCQASPLSPIHTVWEPAAGGGHIVEVLRKHGCQVDATDVDPRDFPEAGKLDFLTELPEWYGLGSPDAIITNPPYKDDLAELFCRRALEYQDVRLIAMLMRSDFKHSATRKYLWQPPFAYEVVLCGRPRWDAWWTGVKAKSSGMHNYSWYVWDRDWTERSTQFFEGKTEKKPRTNLGKEVDALIGAEADAANVSFEDLL